MEYQPEHPVGESESFHTGCLNSLLQAPALEILEEYDIVRVLWFRPIRVWFNLVQVWFRFHLHFSPSSGLFVPTPSLGRPPFRREVLKLDDM